MRAADLRLEELLQIPEEGGAVRLAGERALLFDALAIGLLRRELIEGIGWRPARSVLARFGYAHGRRTAETLRDRFPWDSPRDWQTAGGRLHSLLGLVRVEEPAEPWDQPPPFADSVWHESYEAEQHRLQFGLADEPVCWSLAGFASGYLSFCNDREIIAMEVRCVGRGDPVCRVVARSREEWGDALADHPLAAAPCSLDAVLLEVTGKLRRVERKLRARRRALAKAAGVERLESGLVVASPAMARTIEMARRVARVDSPVLLTGESGVGKERIARLIHEESARAAGPFVGVNCGAIPETLVESELFGHRRGAFTGASQDRPGLFEAAHHGTLLLDEIGELPPASQVKLLRAIQEGEVRRVGEERSRKVDVRILAATHRDLATEVKAGGFRQDLYYRLRVVEIPIPPLRERREDVLPLARYFLSLSAKKMGRREARLTPPAAELLLRYPWPGNIRELENVIERALVLSGRREIRPEDWPEEVRGTGSSASRVESGRTLADVERDYILAVLRDCGGNRARAADRLGIGTATLYRKLKRYGTD